MLDFPMLQFHPAVCGIEAQTKKRGFKHRQNNTLWVANTMATQITVRRQFPSLRPRQPLHAAVCGWEAGEPNTPRHCGPATERHVFGTV
jgi:hypothetical protein